MGHFLEAWTGQNSGKSLVFRVIAGAFALQLHHLFCFAPQHAVPHLFKPYYLTQSYLVNKVSCNLSSCQAFLSLPLETTVA